MPHAIYIVFFFALGASIGSFLNVVVWRLPRGESLVSPPSRCPICLHRLAWYDNIPVFGWLALRGRCRYCLTPISAQYPTVEFITGALFVLYYVLYFMVGGFGPCTMRMVADEFGDIQPKYDYVKSIGEHWPQYVLAVFTVSTLLAASLIDAKNFFIPLSIPVLMTVIGLMYHTILDRPNWPGALNVESGAAGALALGAGVGLVISLTLLWTGRMRRSFSEGWPQLEIEKDPSLLEKQEEGAIARLVRRMIEKFRRPLTPEQESALARHRAAAKARDQEEERIRQAEAAKHPQPVVKEFTKADIRREIRKEMVFLMPPILLGMLAFALVTFVPSVGGPWNKLVLGNTYVSGFLGSLLGGLGGGFVVWFFRIAGSMAFGREAMGMGDVDLMFGVGTIVGAGAVTIAFFVAPIFALALAIYMILVGKRRELPFGPYLSLGTAFVMIYYCPIAGYFAPGLMVFKQIVLSWFGGGGGSGGMGH